MKRVIIVIVLIALILCSYRVVSAGFDSKVLTIASYKEIKTSSESMTKSLAAYNKKNKDDYESSLTNLNSAIKRYQTSKDQYETLIAELGTTVEDEAEENVENEVLLSSAKSYEIDFLLTTIGTYGNKENVDVEMTLVKSGTQDSSTTSLGITLCNLQFKVTGDYINIANFLYDLEDNDELAFEIRDYQMQTGVAAFNVYSVPVNSDTLIEQQQQEQNNTTQEENGSTTNPDGTTTDNTNIASNSVNDNTVTNGTSNNTVSNSAANTVPNSTSNNTIR